jgi:thiol:disulfide interchange protein DsbD
MFTKDDTWSAMAASEPNAAKAVLTITEARPANRLMFLQAGGKEIVLEFRALSPDGRAIDFAVIDKNVTKAVDRAPDDLVREERTRPRAEKPVVWGHGSSGLTSALASAKASGKLVFIDFEATWCGPCHTMDQYIWTDAEVAARLGSGFVGVKIDADTEKAIVKKYNIAGYPTMVVVDATGKEVKRVVDYQSSQQMLAFLR